MHWREQIHCDPAIRAGRPVVKGTRLTVDFLLGLLDAGWSEAQLLESYPALTREGIRAVLAYPTECGSAST